MVVNEAMNIFSSRKLLFSPQHMFPNPEHKYCIFPSFVLSRCRQDWSRCCVSNTFPAFYLLAVQAFLSLWYFARFPGFKNKLLRESDYDILRNALRLTRKWLDLCSHQPSFNFSSLHFSRRSVRRKTLIYRPSGPMNRRLERKILIQQEIDNRRRYAVEGIDESHRDNRRINFWVFLNKHGFSGQPQIIEIPSWTQQFKPPLSLQLNCNSISWLSAFWSGLKHNNKFVQAAPVTKRCQPYGPQKAIQSALLKLHSTCAFSRNPLKNWDVDIYRSSFAYFRQPDVFGWKLFLACSIIHDKWQELHPFSRSFTFFTNFPFSRSPPDFLPDLNNCTQAPLSLLQPICIHI